MIHILPILEKLMRSQATGAYAGYGFNDETNFNCYKDDGRTLYTETGIICKSIYYCFDVSSSSVNRCSEVLLIIFVGLIIRNLSGGDLIEYGYSTDSFGIYNWVWYLMGRRCFQECVLQNYLLHHGLAVTY
jgi:hypothetical protein